MEVTRVAWYVDSWAVLDGLAFASRRPADSLDAEATVFLSVPDLEPIPVGRISTALRAQRASFQDGFRDENGNELAFDTLDQVREVIRRAYLGGGLGPAPVAVEPPPVDPLLREAERPPDGPPPRAGGSFLDAQMEQLGTDPRVWKDYSALQDPVRRRKLFEAMHHDEATTLFYPYLQAFGAATVLEFLHVNWKHLYHAEVRETLAQWTHLLIATGLSEGLPPYWELLRYHGMPEPARYFLESRPVSFWAAPLVASKGLLFRLPCPLRKHWDRHIQTLGHKLLLPLVDRHYFAGNQALPEFIPLLFCSLIMAVKPALAVEDHSPLESVDRHRLLGRALWWLTREMPNVTLPDAVERQLSDFAWARLGENPVR
jgi:hypothetical protein